MQPLLQDYRYYDVFSAVFKISDKCNLECSYCYRENALKNDKLHHMPLEVIERTLDSLLHYKHWLYTRHGWSKKPSLYFIWHGGEPLIIGINQINKILNLQKKYKEKGLDIINCIQTNGTLINKSFLDVFQKEHFRVGISIDGPASVHNKHRVYRNGIQSFHDTYKGIQMLKKLKYPWSVISVITTESIGQEEAIFEFFIAEKPFEIDFTPAFFYETDISLSPDNYAQFMIKMFDLWVSKKNPPFDIRFFRDVLYILGYYDTEKDQIICELAGMCHRNISILTNGDVYSCECLNAKPSNKIGNILSETFIDVVQSESFVRLSQITNTYCKDCLSCEVFFVCKAGCYNRRLPNENEKSRLDFYCDARKKIFHHIIDWIENSSTKTLQPLKIQNMNYRRQLTEPLIFNR